MKLTIIVMQLLLLGCLATQAQEVSKKYDLRLGISDGTLTNKKVGLGNSFFSDLTDGTMTKDNDKTWNKSFTITTGIRYYINKKFSVGGDAVFQHIKHQLPTDSTKYRDPNIKIKLISILPGVEYTYYQSNLISIYSSATVGISIANTKEINKNIGTRFKFQFAGQINPIGIKIGKNLGGYAELGIGIKGYATSGIFYKF